MMRRLILGAGAALAAMASAAPAQAQEFVMGDVLTVGFGFCPKGTLEAAGTILSIANNSALFSLLGTTYGGNGTTTFALPDLRSRYPIGQGQGPGLADYPQGTVSGMERVTLLMPNLPSHTHGGAVRAVSGAPNTDDPTAAALADFPAGRPIYNKSVPPGVNMRFGTAVIDPAGRSQPVPIRDPFLALRYCVVTEGIYPSRP